MLLVDAHTGQVVTRIPLVYQLLGYPDRAIYDCEATNTYPGTPVRMEGNPPTDDPLNPYTAGEEVEDADLVYEYFGDAYQFYCNHHSRDSIDGDGKALRAEVRYCMEEGCAWGMGWSHENGLDQLVVGTGGWVCDDAVAHEFTHSVTYHESGLRYLNESGAISESFSDVWGEYVDLTNGRGDDAPAVDYLVGEDLPLSIRLLTATTWTGTFIPASGLRNMAAPSNFQSFILLTLSIQVHPDSYNSPDFYRVTEGEGGYDHGAVHYNCGVNNKLCYLLTDGGTFNGRYIYAMGIDIMADVYYECQTNLLVPGADYRDLYFALTQASVNLNLTSAQRENVEDACDAVEISSRPYVVIKNEYGHPVVQFHDNGNVVLQYGEVLTQQAIADTPGASETIMKDGGGDPVALVDPDSGNLYLTGNLYENVSVVWSFPDDGLHIRDDDGTTVAFINMEGFFDSLVEHDFPYYVPAGSLILEGEVICLDY